MHLKRFILGVMGLLIFPAISHADFITTWETTTANESITIPTDAGGSYSYTVDWGDATTDLTVYTGDATHTYVTPGTYTVTITGTFTRISMVSNPTSGTQIRSVEQWGTNTWSAMTNAFQNTPNFAINAIDTPDLSAVTDMQFMFAGSSMNQSINTWDVSNVTNMASLFEGATAFNQPLNSWNTANVTDMNAMFKGASSFNQDISSWNVGNVTSMQEMFQGATVFDQPLGAWNTGSVNNMIGMFQNAIAFNQSLNGWDVSAVSNMTRMFANAQAFNQPLNLWDVSSVADMTRMFEAARSFNQDISSWNTSSVTSMNGMFSNTDDFNQPLNSWDVSNVTDMSNMFGSASVFSQPLNNWNTGNVTNMSGMFSNTTVFNQDLNNWNVSNVSMFSSMFYNATAFNQLLTNWTTTSATLMGNMFDGASSFNQNIENFDMSSVVLVSNMLQGTNLSQLTYDAILTGWSSQSLQNGLALGNVPSDYCATTAHDTITTTFSWTINDNGLATGCSTVVVTPPTTTTYTGGGSVPSFSMTLASQDNNNDTNSTSTSSNDEEDDDETLTLAPQNEETTEVEMVVETEEIVESEELICNVIQLERMDENIGNGVSTQFFNDVTSTDQGYEALIRLAEQGIISGSGNGNFANLDMNINRAEITKILSIAREDLILGENCEIYSVFFDVTADDWFAPYVENMEIQEIISGYPDGNFRPEQNIVLAEMYKMLAIGFGYITEDEAIQNANIFNQQWYEPYKDVLETNNAIPGTIQELEAGKTLTRGEVFIFVDAVLSAQ